MGAQSVESAGDGSGSSGSESSFFLGSRLPAAWFGDGTDDDSGCSLDAAGKTSEKTEGKNILDLFSESPAASKDEELEHSQESVEKSALRVGLAASTLQVSSKDFCNTCRTPLFPYSGLWSVVVLVVVVVAAAAVVVVVVVAATVHRVRRHLSCANLALGATLKVCIGLLCEA